MKDDEIFNNLMNKIKTGTSKVKSGKWTLSDYYFKMSDFFNQIEPSKGIHMTGAFNFKEDAEEFKQLAIKELNNEKQ